MRSLKNTERVYKNATTAEVRRLTSNDFLNDSLVDFQLKLIAQALLLESPVYRGIRIKRNAQWLYVPTEITRQRFEWKKPVVLYASRDNEGAREAARAIVNGVRQRRMRVLHGSSAELNRLAANFRVSSWTPLRWRDAPVGARVQRQGRDGVVEAVLADGRRRVRWEPLIFPHRQEKLEAQAPGTPLR